MFIFELKIESYHLEILRMTSLLCSASHQPPRQEERPLMRSILHGVAAYASKAMKAATVIVLKMAALALVSTIAATIALAVAVSMSAMTGVASLAIYASPDIDTATCSGHVGVT